MVDGQHTPDTIGINLLLADRFHGANLGIATIVACARFLEVVVVGLDQEPSTSGRIESPHIDQLGTAPCHDGSLAGLHSCHDQVAGRRDWNFAEEIDRLVEIVDLLGLHGLSDRGEESGTPQDRNVEPVPVHVATVPLILGHAEHTVPHPGVESGVGPKGHSSELRVVVADKVHDDGQRLQRRSEAVVQISTVDDLPRSCLGDDPRAGVEGHGALLLRGEEVVEHAQNRHLLELHLGDASDAFKLFEDVLGEDASRFEFVADHLLQDGGDVLQLLVVVDGGQSGFEQILLCQGDGIPTMCWFDVEI
mmetsp:Transcript_19034/g.40997  ORF Transcript_19034/g.40997 Transcript_19034/m.40997 type:complete len:306 (-) Transcript_19034:164-1081(-)